MSSSKMRKDRMINELRILEKVMHQHVVRIYELMHDKTNFYIVSELVTTGDMAKLMCQRQKE
jgi:serine/threonine protein kinase